MTKKKSKKTKKKVNKRKLMTREERLQATPKWIAKYEKKDINTLRAYKKRYGVSLECAVEELNMCGIHIDPEHVDKLESRQKKMMEQKKKRIRKKRKEERPEKNKKTQTINDEDYFQDFYFIAGYTSGGAPFGIRYDEMEED